MPELNDEKPCLVKAGQGFSVLYKNRYMYSAYAPEKHILAAINSLKLLPGTFILACSPCLCTGLAELLARLPADCFVLGCECDDKLYSFARDRLPPVHDRYAAAEPSELPSVPLLLNARHGVLKDGTVLPPPGTFRRVLRIDFSAGVQFHSRYYDELAAAAEDAVGQFWKNRITLARLGRKYSRNLFRNISRLPYETPVQNLFHTVSKPIMVLGAGESAEDAISIIARSPRTFYVLSVDALLPALFSAGITPDAAVCDEAQSAIAGAFLGMQRGIRVFAGITSWPHIFDMCADKAQLCSYSTRYDDTEFFERLAHRRFFPPVLPPLGSVGLTAVYIALLLRRDASVPVYFSGLDFSYSAGRTHARGTPAQSARLYSSCRIMPVQSYGPSFGPASLPQAGKDGETVYTVPSLLSYAQMFSNMFRDIPNLFDSGKSGIPLGIAYGDIRNAADSESRAGQAGRQPGNPGTRVTAPSQSDIMEFYTEEETALNTLKSILSSGQDMNEQERNSMITELLRGREYLYLHFPDGYRLSLSQSFLKRVRTEIDFFLKDIAVGKELLSGRTESC